MFFRPLWLLFAIGWFAIGIVKRKDPALLKFEFKSLIDYADCDGYYYAMECAIIFFVWCFVYGMGSIIWKCLWVN